jgi:hypothetical protein
VALHDLLNVLPAFVDHIRRANERTTRPRQLDTLRQQFELPTIWAQVFG